MSSSSHDVGITQEDKRALVAGMIALHSEIQTEIVKDQIDPARLLRLLGAGMNQTLVALAAILSPGDLPIPNDSLG